MSIILAYPSISAPQVSVVLPDCEQLPVSRPRRKYQQQFETDAGSVIVYDFGGSSRSFSLSLYPLSQSQAAAIEDFFYKPLGGGGVNGRAGTWQLQDSLGRTYTVRFAQDVMEPQQRGPSAWDVAITVREV